MDQIPYMYLGFDIRKISFQKNQNEEFTELRISVDSQNFDKESNIYAFAVKIEIDYEESKNNELIYASGFQLFDEDVIKNIEKDEESSNYLSVFLSIVIPFIRESIVSITKDAGKIVMMPTLDCRMISFDETLVLTVAND